MIGGLRGRLVNQRRDRYSGVQKVDDIVQLFDLSRCEARLLLMHFSWDMEHLKDKCGSLCSCTSDPQGMPAHHINESWQRRGQCLARAPPCVATFFGGKKRYLGCILKGCIPSIVLHETPPRAKLTM